MPLIGRHQQQPRRVGRAARDHDDVGRVDLLLAVAVDDNPGHRAPAGVGFKPLHAGTRAQRDVGVLQRWRHRNHLGVGLGVHQAGESVAGVAADAAAVHAVGLVEQNGAGCERRCVAGAPQAVGDLLHARFVRDRRMRVRRARRRVGGVAEVGSALAAHLVQLFSSRVPGLEFIVAQRPIRRHAIGRAVGLKILLTQPEQCRAEQLGRAAHKVVHLGLESLARAV